MSKPKNDKNIDIPDSVLRDLLTPSEIRMLKNRWQIMNLLKEGLTIRAISERVEVGTDTVVRVSKMTNSKEINPVQKNKLKSNTPWIFGKNS